MNPILFIEVILLVGTIVNCLAGAVMIDRSLEARKVNLSQFDQLEPRPLQQLPKTLRIFIIIINILTGALWLGALLVILVESAKAATPDIVVLITGLFGVASTVSACILFGFPNQTPRQSYFGSHALFWTAIVQLFITIGSLLLLLDI